MWVDTKGEDGPQCWHDTPECALLAQPRPHLSCKSLLYALQSILSSTSIRVTCGTHEYFKSSTTTLPAGAMHVQIVGECSKEQPTVRVLNGSNLELHGITRIVVRELVIETWGKHGDLQLANNNSILYISNCTDVRLQNIAVRISAPRGIGILLRHTAAGGNIILYNVSIQHSGTHGTGIHCNITRYDCHSNKWSTVGQLLEPHVRCTAVSLSRRSFLVCGGLSDARDSNTKLSSVEVVSVQ